MAQLGLRRWITILILAVCSFLVLNQLVLQFGPRPHKVPPTPVDKPADKVDDGRFRWADLPVHYPAISPRPIPTGRPKKLPKVQHSFTTETTSQVNERQVRRKAVQDVFTRTWNAYKERAWLKDELRPISGSYLNSFGGWAATLVDTLDTLYIMDMKEEFATAVRAVKSIDFGVSEEQTLNVFEMTIRYLGGLLSAYDLSGDRILIDKAVEVGEMLYVAFDTPNRMPLCRWEWRKALAGQAQVAGSGTLVSEIGSLSLEFTRLSQITNNPKWFDAIQRISEVFGEQQFMTKLPGLWPVVVDARQQNFTEDTGFTLGGMSDSLYEYLPKEYALLGGLLPLYRIMYEDSMTTAIQHIFFRPMVPDNADILISGNARAESPSVVALDPQGQHLACFTGGMLGLGSRLFNLPHHLSIARKLVDGCIWAYNALPLEIMPETFHLIPCTPPSPCIWDEAKWHSSILARLSSDDTRTVSEVIAEKRLPPGFTDIGDTRYILRPEAIESIFILYRITGDRSLQDVAWRMFLTIDKYTKTEFANAALDDVTVLDGNPPKADRMESFWTAETLKYFYLIFSEPDLISLDEYVLNTEAHPFRRPV